MSMGVIQSMNENTKVKDIILVTEDDDGTVHEYHPNCALMFFAMMESMSRTEVNWVSANVAYIDERLSQTAQLQAQEQVNDKFEEFLREYDED